jgi:hypothetical protein
MLHRKQKIPFSSWPDLSSAWNNVFLVTTVTNRVLDLEFASVSVADHLIIWSEIAPKATTMVAVVQTVVVVRMDRIILVPREESHMKSLFRTVPRRFGVAVVAATAANGPLGLTAHKTTDHVKGWQPDQTTDTSDASSTAAASTNNDNASASQAPAGNLASIPSIAGFTLVGNAGFYGACDDKDAAGTNYAVPSKGRGGW